MSSWKTRAPKTKSSRRVFATKTGADQPAANRRSDPNDHIVHATRTCPDCETRTAVQLYHFSFNDGRNVSIAHACEHVIRDCQPDDPPRAEWRPRTPYPQRHLFQQPSAQLRPPAF